MVLDKSLSSPPSTILHNSCIKQCMLNGRTHALHNEDSKLSSLHLQSNDLGQWVLRKTFLCLILQRPSQNQIYMVNQMSNGINQPHVSKLLNILLLKNQGALYNKRLLQKTQTLIISKNCGRKTEVLNYQTHIRHLSGNPQLTKQEFLTFKCSFLNLWYYIPAKLYRMKSLNNTTCWKNCG